MKQVQLVLEAYTPEKYEMGLLEYDYWRKKIDVFMGFLDENDKKLYVGEFPNRSIVKPCLISHDDKFEIGDKIYHALTMRVLQYDGFLPPSPYPADAIHEPEYTHQRDYKKVIVMPDEIGWFVKDNLRDSRTDKQVEYLQAILDNERKCWLDMEIINSDKETNTVFGKILLPIVQPKRIDGKVIIYLSEEK